MQPGDVVSFINKKTTQLNFGIITAINGNVATIQAFFGPTKTFNRKTNQLTYLCNQNFLYQRLVEMANGLGVKQAQA